MDHTDASPLLPVQHQVGGRGLAWLVGTGIRQALKLIFNRRTQEMGSFLEIVRKHLANGRLWLGWHLCTCGTCVSRSLSWEAKTSDAQWRASFRVCHRCLGHSWPAQAQCACGGATLASPGSAVERWAPC